MTSEFDWDDDNLDKVARHGITPDEIEAVFADRSRLSVPAYHVQGERRRAIIGATDEGRILFVVFAAGWRASSQPMTRASATAGSIAVEGGNAWSEGRRSH